MQSVIIVTLNNELYKIPVPEREQNRVGFLRLSSKLIELHKSPLLSMLIIITLIATKIIINDNKIYREKSIPLWCPVF